MSPIGESPGPSQSTATPSQRTTRQPTTLKSKRTTGDTTVTNVEEGTLLLEKLRLTIHGEPYTPANITLTLLQIAAGPGVGATAADCIRAVAFIIRENANTEAADDITQAVLEGIRGPAKALAASLAVIEIASDTLTETAASLGHATANFRAECATNNQRISETVEKLGEATGPTQRTYTDATQPPRLPAAHADVISRGDARARQILIDKLPNALTSELADMSEIQLVLKADLAVEMMGVAAGDRPAGMKFQGVMKLSNGGVVYEMQTEEQARWLRKEDVMRAFLAQYGDFVIKERRTMWWRSTSPSLSWRGRPRQPATSRKPTEWRKVM